MNNPTFTIPTFASIRTVRERTPTRETRDALRYYTKMGVILTVIGLLLLVIALASIGLGIYMAVEPTTRGSGKLFAIWWVPGLAAAF